MPRGGGHCGRWRLDRREHAWKGQADECRSPGGPRRDPSLSARRHPSARRSRRGYPSGTDRSAGRRWAIRRPLDSPRVIFRLIAFFINCRSRLSRIATGDQGLFLRHHVFAEMGGYPEIPLMEDVEFSTRLKRCGTIACLRLAVTASARKWEREGVVRTVLLMWMLRLLYFFGVRPTRLHRLYYGHLPPSE